MIVVPVSHAAHAEGSVYVSAVVEHLVGELRGTMEAIPQVAI